MASLQREVEALCSACEQKAEEEEERYFNALVSQLRLSEDTSSSSSSSARAKGAQLASMVREMEEEHAAAQRRQRDLARWRKRWTDHYGAAAGYVTVDSGAQLPLARLTVRSPFIISPTLLDIQLLPVKPSDFPPWTFTSVGYGF